jgi:hypothetical protein
MAANWAEAEACARCEGVLWMLRAFWREADGMVHGARAWREAGCRLRAAARANERGGRRTADMLVTARVAQRIGGAGRRRSIVSNYCCPAARGGAVRE